MTTTQKAKESTNRVPRELETREATEESFEWTPATNLPKPPEHPDWEYRYVRTSMLGEPDNRNVSVRMREGWEPAPLEDIPELAHEQSDHGSQWAKKGHLEIGGQLLCRMPRAKVDARNRYYAERAQRQMDGVNSQLMSNNDARMPMFREHRTTTSTGNFGDGTP